MKHLFRKTSISALALVAILFQTSCAVQYPDLPYSTGEKFAQGFGLDDPNDVCKHGFRKIYFFVKSEAKILEPLAQWDCLDEDSAYEVSLLEEYSGQRENAAINQEYERIMKKYRVEGWGLRGNSWVHWIEED